LVYRAGYIAKDSLDLAEGYVGLLFENRGLLKELFNIMGGKAQYSLVFWAGGIAEKSLDLAGGYVGLLFENKELFKVMDEEAQSELVYRAALLVENSLDLVKGYVNLMLENKDLLKELFNIMDKKAQAMLVSWAGYIAKNSLDKASGYVKLFSNASNKRLKVDDLERVNGFLQDVSFSAGDVEVLASEKGDVYEKVRRLVAYARLRGAGFDLDKPSLSNAWLRQVFEKGLGYVSQRFSVDNPEFFVKDFDDVLRFALIPDEYVADVGGLFNSISKIESEKGREFKLGKVYHNERLSLVKTSVKPELLVDMFVKAMVGRWAKVKPTSKGRLGVFFSGQGGKREESVKFTRELLKNFEGGKKLKQALLYVRSSERPENIFRDIKDDYQKLRQGDREAGKRILNYFYERFVKPGLPEKVEPLSDIIDSIRGVYGLRTQSYVGEVIEMEKPGVDFLFDSTNTSCCAFMPLGENKWASLVYLADRDVGLLKYKLESFTGSKDDVGVAIMAKCKDDQGNKVLLVDSVEFGRAFRDVVKGWEEKFYKAIVKAAKDSGVDYVLFNIDVYNPSPDRFNKYLKRKGLNLETVSLEKLHALPEGFSKTYLEAFGGKAKPEGKVKGYILKLK
ncbi:hypothetical protein J7L02_03990, partial [Candidatus Woesearchaeota archaeon]|nr:hypothetical protein [Candidatus Woesearchaeota archaeon]